jgi:hypothetical protein
MVSRICIANTWIYLGINKGGKNASTPSGEACHPSRGEFLEKCRRGRRLYGFIIQNHYCICLHKKIEYGIRIMPLFQVEV